MDLYYTDVLWAQWRHYEPNLMEDIYSKILSKLKGQNPNKKLHFLDIGAGSLPLLHTLPKIANKLLRNDQCLLYHALDFAYKQEHGKATQMLELAKKNIEIFKNSILKNDSYPQYKIDLKYLDITQAELKIDSYPKAFLGHTRGMFQHIPKKKLKVALKNYAQLTKFALIIEPEWSTFKIQVNNQDLATNLGNDANRYLKITDILENASQKFPKTQNRQLIQSLKDNIAEFFKLIEIYPSHCKIELKYEERLVRDFYLNLIIENASNPDNDISLDEIDRDFWINSNTRLKKIDILFDHIGFFGQSKFN